MGQECCRPVNKAEAEINNIEKQNSSIDSDEEESWRNRKDPIHKKDQIMNFYGTEIVNTTKTMMKQCSFKLNAHESNLAVIKQMESEKQDTKKQFGVFIKKGETGVQDDLKITVEQLSFKGKFLNNNHLYFHLYQTTFINVSYIRYMNAADRQKIQQSIALLQSLLGGSGSDSGAPAGILVPGFDQEVHKFTKIAQQLEPQIKELNSVLVDAIKLMQNIMAYSTICKKPTDNVQHALQNKFKEMAVKIDTVAKNRNFDYHCRAVKELMSAHFWVFVDAPGYVFQGAIQSADFNAIKFQKLKNAGHNDWYKAVGSAYRLLESFVKKNYNMGLIYSHNGQGNWEDLTKGGSIQQQQGHESKHDHSSHQGKQEAPKAPKKPKRQLQGLNWLVANFENQKLSFAPGELQMKHGIFLQNCHDSILSIEDKFKSLQMNKCKNVTLIVTKCISGVEAMNSQNINIIVKGPIPSIAIDKCQKVRLVLSEEHMNCDIVSSKVTEFHIAYAKSNGNESKDHTVSEQLITRWNPNSKKFETNIYDKFL